MLFQITQEMIDDVCAAWIATLNYKPTIEFECNPYDDAFGKMLLVQGYSIIPRKSERGVLEFEYGTTVITSYNPPDGDYVELGVESNFFDSIARCVGIEAKEKFSNLIEGASLARFERYNPQ